MPTPDPAPPAEPSLVNTPPAGDPPPATPPKATTAPPATPPAKADPPPPKPTEPSTLLTEGNDPPPQDPPKGTEPPAAISLKPPVGVNPDDPGLKQFTQFASEKKLSQEQAQGALDLYAEALEKQSVNMRAAFAEQKSAWAKESRTDAEFGGDKLASSLNLAKRAIDKYGSKGLREMLDQSGLGNHPEVIRFFTRIGRTLNEDSFAGALGSRTAPASEKKTEEQRLEKKYPSMFTQKKE